MKQENNIPPVDGNNKVVKCNLDLLHSQPDSGQKQKNKNTGAGSGKQKMTTQPIHIKFDKNTPQVREALANPYGFDLSEENLIVFKIEKIKFTVMGFRATTQFDTLLATVKICSHPHIQDEYTYVQKINLYDNDRVNTFCRTAAFNLKITEAEIKKGISSLRERLERYRLDEIKNTSNAEEKQIPITAKEQKEAIEILKADNLMDCIEGLLKQAGVITEIENGMRLFLILLSRQFDKPLHILFQGSPELVRMLMDTVTSTIPTAQLHEQTSMSASSLYYSKSKNYWKNKVVCVGNIDKQFKGANTIKEFIENQVLKRYTTESDYHTRRLYSSNKIVEGPICLLGYSEDETMNNKYFQECFFIRVNENEKSKAEMFQYLKMESAGLIDAQKQNEAVRCLMNIQNLLKKVNVIIPYAMELEIPNQVFQPFRSLNQLLQLIKTIALLHQYQLKTKRDANGLEYIEATVEHLQIAIELFKSILVTQSDLLSPGQRAFLERLKAQVEEKNNSFKIPDMMQALKIKRSSFYREFNVLKDLRYVIPSGGNKKNGIDYKIIQWDDYTQLKKGTDILEEQLQQIQQLSFPQESQKFPAQSKVSKTQAGKRIEAQPIEVSHEYQ